MAMHMAVDDVLQWLYSNVLWEEPCPKNTSWNTRMLSHARGVGRNGGRREGVGRNKLV